MSNEILRVSNIEKYYGKNGNITKAINNISFTVNKGEFVGIMGASGSGKTTLLNCISTIDKASSGHIYINNNDITKLSSKKISKFRREELGFIFQDFNLLDTLTAYENIALALTICKINYGEINKRITNIADKLNIKDILNKYPYEMSGGQKQRLSIARVFLKNPPILIFDEATSALDNESEQIVQESLEKLAKNRTTLVIAHRLTTIENAEEILMLTEEGIKERGTHKELMKLDGEYAHMVKIHQK